VASERLTRTVRGGLMTAALSRARVRTVAFWLRKAGISVADQGVFSGANFLANVLLARWLGPAEYGAFAVAFSVYLVLLGFHNALILEPMLVFGPARHAHRLDRYVRELVRMHAMVTGPLGLATVLVALAVVHDRSLERALLAAGLALPLTLLVWFARRIPYLRTNPSGSLRASAAYAAVLLAAVGLLRVAGGLSGASAWLVLALAAAIGSLAAGRPVGRGKPVAGGELGLRKVFAEHWGFGRWIVPAALVNLGTGQLQVILTGTVAGLEAAGALRAMLIPGLSLTTQAFMALGQLLIPVITRDYTSGDWQALRRKTKLVASTLTAIALIYEAGLVAFAEPLVLLLYGEQFLHAAWLLPIVGSIGVFTAAATGFSFSLRAMQKPEYHFVTAALVDPIGLATAFALTSLWGLAGAAASLVCYYAAVLGVTLLLYQRWAPVSHLAPQEREAGTR
jgi:O-antigen/teichoic acid export membrane protein